jgi:hypothetical protein
LKKQAFTIGQAYSAFKELHKMVESIKNANDPATAKNIAAELPKAMAEFNKNMEMLTKLIRPQNQ